MLYSSIFLFLFFFVLFFILFIYSFVFIFIFIFIFYFYFIFLFLSSGIYDGFDGSSSSFFNPTLTPTSVLITKQITISQKKTEKETKKQPKKINKSNKTKNENKKTNLENTVFNNTLPFIATSGREGNLTLKIEQFVCSISFKVSNYSTSTPQLYSLIIFHGAYIVGGQVLFPLQVCALVKCQNLSVSSCSVFSFNTDTTFDYFNISANLDPNGVVLSMAASNNLFIFDSPLFQLYKLPDLYLFNTTSKFQNQTLMNAGFWNVIY